MRADPEKLGRWAMEMEKDYDGAIMAGVPPDNLGEAINQRASAGARLVEAREQLGRVKNSDGDQKLAEAERRLEVAEALYAEAREVERQLLQEKYGR